MGHAGLFLLIIVHFHHNSNINWKTVDVGLANRAQGRCIVGANGSIELWQPLNRWTYFLSLYVQPELVLMISFL